MKFPAHFNLTLSPDDKADLTAARQSFIGSMTGLTEAQKLDRAKVIAGGIRPADSYTRAMARQVVDAATARNDITRLQGELKAVEEDLQRGGYRPKDPQWRGAALLRKEELKRELVNNHARLVGIAEDTLETAQKKAAVEFRQARQQAARNAADLSRFPFAASARLMNGNYRERFLRRALVNAPGLYEAMRQAAEWHAHKPAR